MAYIIRGQQHERHPLEIVDTAAMEEVSILNSGVKSASYEASCACAVRHRTGAISIATELFVATAIDRLRLPITAWNADGDVRAKLGGR